MSEGGYPSHTSACTRMHIRVRERTRTSTHTRTCTLTYTHMYKTHKTHPKNPHTYARTPPPSSTPASPVATRRRSGRTARAPSPSPRARCRRRASRRASARALDQTPAPRSAANRSGGRAAKWCGKGKVSRGWGRDGDRMYTTGMQTLHTGVVQTKPS
eukprot:366558-Chlamydomonas_euryale.AAC.23